MPVNDGEGNYATEHESAPSADCENNVFGVLEDGLEEHDSLETVGAVHRCLFHALRANPKVETSGAFSTEPEGTDVELPLITLASFLDNNGRDGKKLWIVIDAVVFNVTDYMYKHPGGKVPLMQNAECDSTYQFYKTHGRKGNTRPLLRRLKSLAVGILDRNEFPLVPGYQAVDEGNCPNVSLRRQFMTQFPAAFK